MNEKGDGVLVQEVDVLKLVRTIGKRSKVSQAKILQRLETVIHDKQEFSEVRKFVLDEINELTRAYIKATFGDIEFLIK